MEQPIQTEEPTKKEKPIQFNFLEYTTIIYALLTFLAYSYIDIYYSQWGIEIYSFLDASEVLLSLFSQINLILIVLLLSFGFIYMLKYIANPLHLTDKLSHYIVPINGNKEVIINRYLTFQLILFAFIELILFISFLIDRDEYVYIFSALSIGLIILILPKFISSPIEQEVYRSNIQKNLLRIIIVLVCVFLFNVGGARVKYLQVKDKYYVTTFNFDDKSTNYKTNDSLIFIGTTSKYIFIRNTKSNTNLIFEKGSINNLKLVLKYTK